MIRSRCPEPWRNGVHEEYLCSDGSTVCRACGERARPEAAVATVEALEIEVKKASAAVARLVRTAKATRGAEKDVAWGKVHAAQRHLSWARGRLVVLRAEQKRYERTDVFTHSTQTTHLAAKERSTLHTKSQGRGSRGTGKGGKSRPPAK